jgi:hypothetical protein
MSGNSALGTNGDDAATRKIRALAASGSPIDEAPVNGGPEEFENELGGLVMDVIWSFIEFAENANCGADIETADLYHKNQHARQGTVLETVFFHHGCDTRGFEWARGGFECLEDGRSEGGHHPSGW